MPSKHDWSLAELPPEIIYRRNRKTHIQNILLLAYSISEEHDLNYFKQDLFRGKLGEWWQIYFCRFDQWKYIYLPYSFMLASNRNSKFWNVNAYANNYTGLCWSLDEVFNVLKLILPFSHRCLNSVKTVNSPEHPPKKHCVCINYAFSIFVDVCFLVYLELTLPKNTQN